MEDQKPEVEEKGFNDDELKDIMDEIESLEKEFSDDGQQAEVVVDGPSEEEAVIAEESPAEEMMAEEVVESDEASLQDQIDCEIQAAAEHVEQEEVEQESVHVEESPSAEVVPMSSKEPGEMSFSGKGKCSFKWIFL